MAKQANIRLDKPKVDRSGAKDFSSFSRVILIPSSSSFPAQCDCERWTLCHFAQVRLPLSNPGLHDNCSDVL